MLHSVQYYRLDAVAFAMLMVFAALAAHRTLRRRHGRGFPKLGWAALAVTLCAGFAVSEITGEHERASLRESIAGIAPTYARETELAGHARLTLDTPADDPTYLAMIAAQVRWTLANPGVDDIYTLRRLDDGRLAFVVDSETDYDRDGRFEGEREERTDIGEVYDEATANMLRTFDGAPQFDDVPETDRWGTWVSAYVPLRDADGNVEAILGVDYDARTWLTHIAWSRAAGLGFVGVLGVIMLATTVIVVITRAELQRREVAERERARLQQQFALASRQAGMAEVATSVLHNVGNVLNSVNVSAGVVRENLAASKVSALARAAGMIRDNRDDLGAFLTTDDRGKLLPDYLVKLSDILAGEQATILGELSTLTRSVEHIKHIVASQQAYAKCGDEREQFDPAQVFEDALGLNALSLERHAVDVVRAFCDVGPVTADRHKVLQILVNLISNAKNAVKENATARRVELRIERGHGEDGGPVVRLVVADNGMGIKDEDLSKVFAHGFTTRKDGHGFGLHSAAIAAQQMKGRLTAASAGVGRGATFTVELPVGTLSGAKAP